MIDVDFGKDVAMLGIGGAGEQSGEAVEELPELPSVRDIGPIDRVGGRVHLVGGARRGAEVVAGDDAEVASATAADGPEEIR